jgi:xanthine dehydrogenase accessory factor
MQGDLSVLLDGRTIPAKISSPIGLAIGAEGPEEIAISIVAELIQRQRSKKIEKVAFS